VEADQATDRIGAQKACDLGIRDIGVDGQNDIPSGGRKEGLLF
jgi:hypothetical protein